MTRKKVYIASPYTIGDVAQNVATAMRMFHHLWLLGYAPLCPLWSHFQHMAAPLPYEDWMEYDFIWLPLCDAVLRLPGVSAGADREVAEAKRLGLPVFFELDDLLTSDGWTITDGKKNRQV